MKKGLHKFLTMFSIVLLAGIIQLLSVCTYAASSNLFSDFNVKELLGHKSNIESISSNHFTISKVTFTNDNSESEVEVESISSKPDKKFLDYTSYFTDLQRVDTPQFKCINISECLKLNKHFCYAINQRIYILFEVYRL